MSNLSTLPKGDSAWLFRKALERIIQQISVLETNIGSSTTGNSANTQVIFNDNGVLRGDAGLTFNAATDLLTVGAATITGDLTVDSSTLKVDSANNRVGIGTTSPSVPFEIYKASGDSKMRITSGSNTLTVGWDDPNGFYYTANTALMAWQLSTGTAMTLNSTGLGVGGSPLASHLIYSQGPVAIAGTASGARTSYISNANACSIYYTDGGASYPFDNFGNLIIQPRTSAARSVIIATGSTTPVERLIVDPTGNVGVGVASPSFKLDVQSTTATFQLKSTTGTNAAYLFTNNTGGDFYFGRDNSTGATFGSGTGYSAILYSAGAYPMAFFTNATERMRIDSSGNLGIGVTPNTWSTGKALEIGASGANVWSYANDNIYVSSNAYFNGGWKYAASSKLATNYTQYQGTHQWLIAPSGTAGNAITFTQAMTLDASGRLLIGTTTATTGINLKIAGGGIYASNTTSISSGSNTLEDRGSAPNTVRLYNATDSNNATDRFVICDAGASVVRAEIRSNGGLANYQANDANLSDERTKTDIKPLASYWNKIKALEVVTFKYKDQAHSDNNIGLIAQQVETVAPELVDVDGFGETPADGVPLKTIYTTDLYHGAIKALQEAMTRIEALEAKLA